MLISEDSAQKKKRKVIRVSHNLYILFKKEGRTVEQGK